MAPGFVAGWLARTNGLAIGAIVGALVAVVSLLLVTLAWGATGLVSSLHFLFFFIAANLVTQSVGGLAGAELRSRRSAV